jgi:hypothetical protein
VKILRAPHPGLPANRSPIPCLAAAVLLAAFPVHARAQAPLENPAEHPEWIFCDDFESTGPLVGWKRYFEHNDHGGKFVPMEGVGLNGSRGMRARWRKGEDEAGNLKVAFGRTPVGDKGIRSAEDFREIYYRFYVRMQEGWTGNPFKLSRATIMAGNNWSQAMVAHVWQGGGNCLALDPVRGTDPEGKLLTTRYNDFPHFKWLGNQGGATPVFDENRANTWLCIESHVKLNDPGQANGIQELWIDGKLEARKADLNFVGNYADYGLNAVFLENYWNNGAPREEERYFDHFVVSTQPIGPLAGIAPPR